MPMRFFLVSVLLIAGCFKLSPTDGGSQKRFQGPRTFNPDDIALPSPYRIELVASGLTFPTGVTFDGEGTPYVTDSGYSYGEVWDTPKLLRIDSQDRQTVMAVGENNGPWTRARHQQQAAACLCRSDASQVGFGPMPAFYENEISETELDSLVSYLKALRRHG